MVSEHSSYRLKSLLAAPLIALLRATAALRRGTLRIYSYATLAHQLQFKLPHSVVVLGRIYVEGTGAIRVGENCHLYPGLTFETRQSGTILLGHGVVISRGAHLVAMESITIGAGSMIGEFTSIRDANHRRTAGTPLREAGYIGSPIYIGKEVWIGRGVTILPGVTIGDGATVGANAVVTRDVPAGATVAGVPARPIQSRTSVSAVNADQS